MRSRLLVPLVFALALALAPRDAGACYGCYGVMQVRAVFGTSIPADGVLAFTYAGALPGPAAWTATLRRVDGDAGSVEVAVEPVVGQLVVVRPLTPLEPGGTYEVAAMIDNGTAVEESDCELSPQVKLLWTFVADPPGLVAPDAPEFDVTYTVEDSPHAFEDAEIVCCSKESFPFEYIGCGLELGEQCASTLGFGILRADIRVDPATWDPQGQIVLEDVEVGATTALRESVEPFCVTPTAIHLATGERAAGSSICPDPALVAEVGEKALDPAEILPCRPLWTCDNGDLGWDPDSCRRWRAGGCACAAGDGGDEPSTLALAVLVIALGRRRARMESRPIPVTGRE